MSGYYRSPTICQDTIVFVCEDDLWTVPVEGGVARRLTSNLGLAGSPRLSPDGELLAFSGREEGPSEVYVMPALGGEAKRLTYQGSNVSVVGWDTDGKHILYSSGAGLAFDPWIWKGFFRWRRTATPTVWSRKPYRFWRCRRRYHREIDTRTGTLETLPRRHSRTTLDRC